MPSTCDLTSREDAVGELLLLGLSNKRIGAKLEISEHTAKLHVNNLISQA